MLDLTNPEVIRVLSSIDPEKPETLWPLIENLTDKTGAGVLEVLQGMKSHLLKDGEDDIIFALMPESGKLAAYAITVKYAEDQTPEFKRALGKAIPFSALVSGRYAANIMQKIKSETHLTDNNG